MARLVLLKHLEFPMVEELLALLVYVEVKDGRHILVCLVLRLSPDKELLAGFQASDVPCLATLINLLTTARVKKRWILMTPPTLLSERTVLKNADYIGFVENEV